MARVSVVVPTHDRAGWVGGAVESALGQTYDDLEVVVVDGASTDGTASVLAGYESDPRVTVLTNETRRGVSAAREQAIAAATGEFVCMLDDDDRWHPEKVERQVERFDRSDGTVGLVYTGAVAYRDGEEIARLHPSRRGDLYPEILVDFGLAPHSSHMYRREAISAVGGIDPAFDRGEDWELCIRLARQYRVEYVDRPLTIVHRHGDNFSDDPRGDVRMRERIVAKHGDAIRQYPAIERRCRARLALAECVTARDEGDYGRAVRRTMGALRADRSRPTLRRALDTWLPHRVKRGVRQVVRATG